MSRFIKVHSCVGGGSFLESTCMMLLIMYQKSLFLILIYFLFINLIFAEKLFYLSFDALMGVIALNICWECNSDGEWCLVCKYMFSKEIGDKYFITLDYSFPCFFFIKQSVVALSSFPLGKDISGFLGWVGLTSDFHVMDSVCCVWVWSKIERSPEALPGLSGKGCFCIIHLGSVMLLLP